MSGGTCMEGKGYFGSHIEECRDDIVEHDSLNSSSCLGCIYFSRLGINNGHCVLPLSKWDECPKILKVQENGILQIL